MGALLPFAPLTPAAPAQADPPVFDGKEIKDLCTITARSQSCPVFPPPPPLLNAGAVAAAGPEIAASLERLQDKAITNTLADHGLPDSDRTAVMSWGRSDAQAELWAVIVEAINTPAGQRTEDQANAVEWMAGLASAQTSEAAMHAGAEYATWAGLDVKHYWQIARTATKDDLTRFLGSDVRPRSPQSTKRGGYCRYSPPDPYSEDYDGSDQATCFTACPSFTGCPIDTPKYDDFVKWGESAATYPTITDAAFVAQAAVVSAGVFFGGIAVAAVAGAIAAAMGAALATTAVATAVIPFAVVATAMEPTAAAIAEAAVIGAGTIGAAAAGAIIVVIMAVIIAVLEGIRVFENDAIPGQLATLVVSARSQVSDPASLIETTEGATTLYSLFIGVTLPLPRTDLGCDNSLIPPWAYTSSVDPNLLIYVPLGSNDVITSPADRQGCLNPPPIPPAALTDPYFLVTRNGRPTSTSTIAIGGDASGNVHQVRLSGNWFVNQTGQPGAGSRAWQSLRLSFSDWDGASNIAWLIRDTSGQPQFVGYRVGDNTSIDFDTCEADGTCWTSDKIHYVGADGLKYSASVQQYQPPTGAPTYSPSNPVEGSPVTFSPGGFRPDSTDKDVHYTWRFQPLHCGVIECVSAPQTPSWETRSGGNDLAPTYTWDNNGSARVQLTATDRHNRSATTEFLVHVGNVAPHVTAMPEYEAEVGKEVELQGSFGDAGASSNINIEVNYGDGQVKRDGVGPNNFPVNEPAITTLPLSTEAEWGLLTTHTYTKPGIYYGTITVSDWGGGVDADTFVVRVTGKQEVAFSALDDRQIGETVEIGATGTWSGSPVTYTASPPTVCTTTGPDDDKVELVGAGRCTVTATQAAYPPLFLAADPVVQSFDVSPALLTITADDQTRVYGGEVPTYTAKFEGLLDGDTPADIKGLTISGAGAEAGVGDHAITPSGATSTKYDISYVPGTEHVTPAPLTITADDKTRVYGTRSPGYSASFEGFVNGDDESDVQDLQIIGAPAGAEVGDYPIEVSGGTSPNYHIKAVNGTEHVTPASLTVTADDKTRAYGDARPTYTASFDGLANGDTPADIERLTFEGAPSRAEVGDYPITPRGARNPNYEITLEAGHEHVIPARLTITADDATKVYGDPNPAFTASYDGLVNGDTEADVTGLQVDGPATGSHVGDHQITPSGASNRNYDIDYATGVLTITPAPLTIKPAAVVVASGGLPAYGWTGHGWVNGDSDATLSEAPHQLPTCQASVDGERLSATTPPGAYPGAVGCSGARNEDYEIDYATADLRVDPVISLAQRGLPESDRKRAYFDGASVTLPMGDVDVPFGSRHRYRFPRVRINDTGTTYVTTTARFRGPVVAEHRVVAEYLTMSRLMRLAEKAGTLGDGEAQRLEDRWGQVQSWIAQHRHARVVAALRQFAGQVRLLSGAGIQESLGADLLDYAQAVYHRVGGTGPV